MECAGLILCSRINNPQIFLYAGSYEWNSTASIASLRMVSISIVTGSPMASMAEPVEATEAGRGAILRYGGLNAANQ
jgi:hypothetical protein